MGQGGVMGKIVLKGAQHDMHMRVDQTWYNDFVSKFRIDRRSWHCSSQAGHSSRGNNAVAGYRNRLGHFVLACHGDHGLAG
jgi:hypothetical protein